MKLTNHTPTIRPEVHTIYVTPAGYTCTCGNVRSALAGGDAARSAYLHKESHEVSVIVDYRLKSS